MTTRAIKKRKFNEIKIFQTFCNTTCRNGRKKRKTRVKSITKNISSCVFSVRRYVNLSIFCKSILNLKLEVPDQNRRDIVKNITKNIIIIKAPLRCIKNETQYSIIPIGCAKTPNNKNLFFVNENAITYINESDRPE